jgi:hypothetical protein
MIMRICTKILRIIVIAAFPFCVCAQSETLSLKPKQISIIDSARIWYSSIKKNCISPNMNPWAIDVYGKTMLVEPNSRFLVANYQNIHKSFIEYDGLFVGYLDEKYGIANTSKNIYGEMWTMVDISYIEGKNPYEKNWIIAHESFHRIQNEIGLPPANLENAHLETKNGRIYLQLELRALQKSLTSEGHERLNALKDALIFRSLRFKQFPNAEAEECRFEMHEGMAEYTGAKLSGYNKEILGKVLADKLKHAEQTKNFKWYFAYLTGPAYGLLLDDYYPDWISNVSVQTNLAKLLQKQLDINMHDKLDNNIQKIIDKYDGKAIIEKENDIYQAKLETRKQYIEKFINDTTLVISLTSEMKISFDPMNAFDLEEYGAIYPGESHISDQWGILETQGDFLLSKDWRFLKISKPILISNQIIKGTDWQLFLNKEWEIELVDADFEIVKQKRDTQ